MTKESIGGRGKKRGLTRTVVALEPEQVEVLRREAMERMVQRRVGRMDTGEVVREAVDAWVQTKDDPVVAALAEAKRAQSAGDAEAAREALVTAERLMKQRAAEVTRKTKCDLDVFAKRAFEKGGKK